MKKGIILFDIDKTLYNSDFASQAHNDEVMKILDTTDADKIKSVKEKYRSTLKNEREYLPEDYLSYLCEAFDSDKINDLLKIYYDEKYRYTYFNAVYSDVVPVLEKLKNSYDLGIYSEGRNKFQRNKFQSLNLNQYFKEDLVFILEAKDNEKSINLIPKGSIVVDDKETICQMLTDSGIRAIWLNRKDDRKLDKIETIYSLLELPAIL